MTFRPAGINPICVADINGDGLKDIKIITSYMGCGIAAMNVRIVYLFQQTNGTFKKVSFSDKYGANKIERDFNGDGNFEIITMNLIGYQNHSYWLYNLYNYQKGNLVNVNNKYNYPIMIQFLYKENYKITNKISPEKMKTFSMPLPNDTHID